MRGWNLGFRQEALIFFPLAVLLLALVALGTLLSYQWAVAGLVEERQTEASRLARRAADADFKSQAQLAERMPLAAGVAILDERGRVLLSHGSFPSGPLLAPFGVVPPESPLSLGPGGDLGPRVAAVVPIGRAPNRRYLRLDLPADRLFSQQRKARALSLVGVAVTVAILVLVVLYLRTLLLPWEKLLEQARRIHGEDSGSVAVEDEVEFLMETFQRAVAALEAPSGDNTTSVDGDSTMAEWDRALSRGFDGGLMILDRKGAVVSISPVGAQLLGLEPVEMGVGLDQALSSLPELRRTVQEAVEEDGPVSSREVGVPGAEGNLSLEVAVHPLRRDDGERRGSLVLFTDRTEARRQAERERLVSSLTELGELAAGVAHELRNGIATLSGYLALIEREPEEESVGDYLEEIRRETNQLERVVRDFLAFARPESHHLEDLDLVTLVRRVASDPSLSPIPVEVSSTPREGIVRGDGELLQRAVSNLLRNAVESHEQALSRSSVQVRIEEAREGLEVIIEDRGQGLPKRVREHLFQPFVSGRAGGVGLGLALARRVLLLHGGSLTLEDRESGGTRARIFLPAVPGTSE
jgi:signal transduction histidine kinase